MDPSYLIPIAIVLVGLFALLERVDRTRFD